MFSVGFQVTEILLTNLMLSLTFPNTANFGFLKTEGSGTRSPNLINYRDKQKKVMIVIIFDLDWRKFTERRKVQSMRNSNVLCFLSMLESACK